MGGSVAMSQWAWFVATLLAWQPDPAALVPLYRQALAEREKQFGPDHPAVARAASDLGLFLRNQGDRAAAEPLLRRALRIDEKVLGADSRVTGEDLENLASVLSSAEALSLIRRAAAHRDPAVAARNLAKEAEYVSSNQATLALYRRALTKQEAASPAGDPLLAVRLNDVALLVKPAEAEPLLRRALAIQEKSLGPTHPETAVTLNNLANVLLATGRAAQAEPISRRALAALEAALGPTHMRIAISASNLGDILRARKDYSGARRLYERALAIEEDLHGPRHSVVDSYVLNLADLLDEMGLHEEARRTRLKAAR
jgi:tetratricopeptide (TPR) repeat protein